MIVNKIKKVFKIYDGTYDLFNTADTTLSAASTTLYLGNANSSIKHSLLVFEPVFIPKDATILSAKLRLTSAATLTAQSCNVQIKLSYGYKNVPTSNSGYLSAKASAQSDYVSWTSIPSWTIDKVYESPDFYNLLQSTISHSSTSGDQHFYGGNVHVHLIDASSTANAYRQFYAYDAGINKSAQLVVEYVTPTKMNDVVVRRNEPIEWAKNYVPAAYGTDNVSDLPRKPIVNLSGNGNLSGLYQYRVSSLLSNPISGENIESTPSSNSSIYTASNQVLVRVPFDPSKFSGYRIYRTKSGESTFYHLVTVVDPLSDIYVDNVADTDIDENNPLVASTSTAFPVLLNNIRYPIRFSNTVVAEIATTAGYVVPSGKTLFITSTWCSAPNVYLRINDTTFLTSPLNVWNSGPYGGASARFNNPIAATSSVSSSDASYMYLGGILADNHDGFVPIAKLVTSSSTYNVPRGKSFVLTTFGQAPNELWTNGRINSSGTPAPMVSCNAWSTNDRAIDFCAMQASIAQTLGGSQTSIVTRTGDANFASLAVSTKQATMNTTQMSRTNTNAAYVYAAMVLKSSGSAITDTTGGRTSNTAISATSLTATVPNHAALITTNRVLLAYVYTKGSNNLSVPVKSVQYAGTPLSRIRVEARSDARVEIWALLNQTNTGGTLTVYTESHTNIWVATSALMNVTQELNSTVLQVQKGGSGSTIPIIAATEGYGNPFVGGGLNQIPSYMIFNGGDVLSTTTTGGVVLCGYEIFN